MTHHRLATVRFRLLALLVALAVVTIACGDDAEVGEDVQTEGGGGGNLSIGEETTTTEAPAITVPTTQAPPSTTAKPTTTTTARPAPTTTAAPRDTGFPISINGDNSEKPQFDPPAAAVAVGTVVRFVNEDTAVRSVVAQNGAFRSPDIPPGGSWSYKATQPGEYNYQDGTRPYAVGRLEVR